MDKLKIGALRRNGDAMFTTAQVEGMTVPALELRMEGPVDRELLDALAEGRLEICGADGVRQGEYLGYSRVLRCSVVVAKLSDTQQELADARAALAEAQAENETLGRENAALLYASLTGEVQARAGIWTASAGSSARGCIPGSSWRRWKQRASSPWRNG